MMNRRTLLTGLISFVAAPAIMRASSLMPVRMMTPTMTAEELIRAVMEHLGAEISANYDKAIADAVAYGTGICDFYGNVYRIEMPSPPLDYRYGLVSKLKEASI